jgi:hypothetical protein
MIEFESVLKERIEDLNVKLKESNNLRETDILINEIDVRMCSRLHGQSEVWRQSTSHRNSRNEEEFQASKAVKRRTMRYS